jgi:hypothetical protein
MKIIIFSQGELLHLLLSPTSEGSPTVHSGAGARNTGNIHLQLALSEISLYHIVHPWSQPLSSLAWAVETPGCLPPLFPMLCPHSRALMGN